MELPSTPAAAPARAAPAEGHIVERALRILAEIGERPGRSGVADLARRTGLPKSTVHRLLGILQTYGAVERHPGGYQLGPASRQLGKGRDRCDEALRRRVMPHHVELHALVGEAVSLAVLREDVVLYLETLYDRTQLSIVESTALRAPAHATAAGKLLLAYQPAVSSRYGMELSLPRLTDHTITTPVRLAAELAQIRGTATAYCREEYVLGMVSVAVGVIGRHGVPVAAMTVGGPRARMDLTTVVTELRHAAQRASAALR